MSFLDELSNLRKDAERYRWLREQRWNYGKIAVVTQPKKAIKPGYDAPSFDRLDSIIDDLMESDKHDK